MDGKAALLEGMKVAAVPIAAAEVGDMDKATPCTEWNLRALIQHMTYELLWVPDLLQGKTIAEVGDTYEGDILGNDHIAAWQSAVAAVQKASADFDPSMTVHLSYADKPADDYLKEVAVDMVIHGWDVAQSLAMDYQPDDKLVAAVHAYLEPRIKGYQDSGATAVAIAVPADASAIDKLVALAGRQP